VVDAVAARLDAYPERSLAHKHVHFLFAERAYRWVYEGEDRNRCFLWHTTPFYAPAVFDRATRAPTRIKRDERLRARVLALVAPEVANLTNASTGVAPTAPAAAWSRRMRRFAGSVLYRTLGPEAERRVRRWLRRSEEPGVGAEMRDVIRAQLRGAGPIGAYLRPGAVERLLDDAPAYPREQFSVVLTVTSLIDGLGGRPVLRAYRDVAMK
jgi:asparagine synthase (glutamine-hydrolysing)